MEITRGNITTISPAAKAVFEKMVRMKKAKEAAKEAAKTEQSAA